MSEKITPRHEVLEEDLPQLRALLDLVSPELECLGDGVDHYQEFETPTDNIVQATRMHIESTGTDVKTLELHEPETGLSYSFTEAVDAQGNREFRFAQSRYDRDEALIDVAREAKLKMPANFFKKLGAAVLGTSEGPAYASQKASARGNQIEWLSQELEGKEAGEAGRTLAKLVAHKFSEQGIDEDTESRIVDEPLPIK